MPNRCYMCKEEEEMSDHILLHCPKTHFVAIDFCFIWCTVGDAFFGERVALELGRRFCW